jgi:CheY-like chemotaxis protein
MAKTVLVVEDSPVQALTLLRLFESQGLNVICAPNGTAGLELAHKHLPDVIVLDIHMPEMDGLETCRHLKQENETNAIPVVLLTGHTEASALRAGLEGGAVDFIPKDAFSDVVLLATLRQLSILPPDA